MTLWAVERGRIALHNLGEAAILEMVDEPKFVASMRDT
jgi:hypothetical protein